MAQQHVTRRFAAMLAADVAGYGRLMVEGENALDNGVNFAARLVTLVQTGRNCESRSQQ